MDNMKEKIEELWLEYRSHTNSEDAWQFKEWLIKKRNNMKNIHRINGNIYITNDEEIKEGDYFLYNKIEIRFKTNGTEYHGGKLCHISGNRRYPVDKSKKIILTTDQSLNGVQAIDNDLLEFLIKNPSCEEVEVEKEYLSNNGVWKEVLLPSEWEVDTKVRHKTIIPKEKTKQLTDLEIAIKLEEIDREPKKETLEQFMASLPYYGHCNYEHLEGIEVGAKWQQKECIVRKI